MPKRSALEADPLVESLASAAERDSGVACLEGYVGSSDRETIRLYGTLNLTYFADIPRDAILDARYLPGRSDGSVQVFMRPDSEIRLHRAHDEQGRGVTISARRVQGDIADANMCIIGCWIDHPAGSAAEAKCIRDCVKGTGIPAVFALTR
jgi:hypothetical protein